MVVKEFGVVWVCMGDMSQLCECFEGSCYRNVCVNAFFINQVLHPIDGCLHLNRYRE